jgi:uncharacterized protein YjiS (DUF1127 family)
MTNVQSSTLQSPAVDASRSALEAIGRLARLPLAILETLLVWQERAQQRRHLAALDERLLSDIGMSRADAAREAAVPFWRLS